MAKKLICKLGVWIAVLGSFAMPILASTVVYYSDVEGNFIKHQRFIHESGAFSRDFEGVYHLKDGYTFVYGGDVVDRGPGSYRILADLLRLKEETPDRVFFIVGNRDLNKIYITRLLAEMQQEKLGVNTQLSQLQAAFERMNAAGVIGFMQVELAAMAGVDVSRITNAQILDGIRDLYSEAHKGLMIRFLRQALVTKRIGSVLFSHTSLNPLNFGQIPGAKSESDLNLWRRKLNDWYRTSIARPLSVRQPELSRYGGPVVINGRLKPNPLSLVYGSFHDQFNNPLSLPISFLEMLNQVGVNTLINGHSPVGEYPYMQSSAVGVVVLHLDNNYSPNQDYPFWVKIKLDPYTDARVDIDVHFTLLDQSGNEIKRSYSVNDAGLIGKRFLDSAIVDVDSAAGTFTTFQWAEKFSPLKRTYENAMRQLLDCSDSFLAQ